MQKETKWLLVSGGAAMLAAMTTKSLLKRGWHAVYGQDPPMNPESPETTWKEAVVWTLAISVVGGLARLGARRGAAKLLPGHAPAHRYD